jgi:hypothetical protein
VKVNKTTSDRQRTRPITHLPISTAKTNFPHF